MLVTVTLVVTVVAALFLWANLKPPSFPPGPYQLPFFGNIIEILMQTPKVALQHYTKTYGGVMSYRLFSQRRILISDPGLMKKAMTDSTLSGRTDIILFNTRDRIITGKDSSPLGILGTSGDTWKNQRRFTLRTLKDLGLGRQTLEPIMQSELEELLEYFNSNQGNKIDISLMFNRSIVNIIWAIVIGKRYSHGDARLVELVDNVDRIMQTFNPFHPVMRIRWVQKLFPNLDILVKTEGNMKDFLSFIEDEMAIHKRKTDGGEDFGSYIGAYQQGMAEAAREGKETPLTQAHLKANIMELFLAGLDTTSSTLLWAMYLLASNQEVQRAMQEELDRVVGRENLPTIAHMNSLPYVTATIYEIQRMADIIPFGVPHEATEDTTIGDYRIPKETGVIFNLSHGLKDPKYWEAPDQFRPQHFLTEDGKVIKPNHFFPFGSGKRLCLGSSMARLELFVFLTTLVHRLSWRLSDDPVVWVKNTMFNRPPNFTILTTSRSSKPHNASG